MFSYFPTLPFFSQGQSLSDNIMSIGTLIYSLSVASLGKMFYLLKNISNVFKVIETENISRVRNFTVRHSALLLLPRKADPYLKVQGFERTA